MQGSDALCRQCFLGQKLSWLAGGKNICPMAEILTEGAAQVDCDQVVMQGAIVTSKRQERSSRGGLSRALRSDSGLLLERNYFAGF